MLLMPQDCKRAAEINTFFLLPSTWKQTRVQDITRGTPDLISLPRICRSECRISPERIICVWTVDTACQSKRMHRARGSKLDSREIWTALVSYGMQHGGSSISQNWVRSHTSSPGRANILYPIHRNCKHQTNIISNIRILWAPSSILVKVDLLNYTASPSAKSNRDIHMNVSCISTNWT